MPLLQQVYVEQSQLETFSHHPQEAHSIPPSPLQLTLLALDCAVFPATFLLLPQAQLSC